ncbi:MAG: hypothetical protein ACXWTY_12015 [Methylobacter sp.]
MAEENDKTALYSVQSPLMHDGEAVGIGGEIELTEREAEPLVAVRVVELKPASKGGKNG